MPLLILLMYLMCCDDRAHDRAMTVRRAPAFACVPVPAIQHVSYCHTTVPAIQQIPVLCTGTRIPHQTVGTLHLCVSHGLGSGLGRVGVDKHEA